MYCKSCGHEILNGEKTCSNCGAEVEQEVIDVPAEKPNAEVSSSYNGFAIAGFVCAFFVSILGLIFSCIALSQIKKSNEKGKGLAIAGLVLSIIPIVLVVMYWLFLIVAATAAAA